MSSCPRGQHGESQHHEAKRGRDVAMELLTPRLVRFDRTDRGGRVVDGLVVLRPGGTPVAGGPVRAGESGIGEAHEGTEHDHAEREQYGEPGKSMELAMWRGHAGIVRISA